MNLEKRCNDLIELKENLSGMPSYHPWKFNGKFYIVLNPCKDHSFSAPFVSLSDWELKEPEKLFINQKQKYLATKIFMPGKIAEVRFYEINKK